MRLLGVVAKRYKQLYLVSGPRSYLGRKTPMSGGHLLNKMLAKRLTTDFLHQTATTLGLLRAHWVWSLSPISIALSLTPAYTGIPWLGDSEPRERVSCCRSKKLLLIFAYQSWDG